MAAERFQREIDNELDYTSESSSQRKLNFEEIIDRNKFTFIIGLIGMIILALGIFLYKDGYLTSSEKVEVIDDRSQEGGGNVELVVEIAGAVEKPGVYKLSDEARIEDLLIVSGGISGDADRAWMERMVNRAAKLVDGQKVYIPSVNEQSSVLSDKSITGGTSGVGSGANKVSVPININTASTTELDSLPGIGPVFAQSIVEHRPYSTVENLLTRKVLRKDIYEKIKDKITAY